MTTMSQARCLGDDTEKWFTEDPDAERELLRICSDCPVRQTCLNEQLAFEGSSGRSNRYGVFGGLTPTQRWKLARDDADRHVTATSNG